MLEEYQVPKGRWHGFNENTVSVCKTYIRFFTGFVEFLDNYKFCITYLDKEKRQLVFEFFKEKESNSLNIYKIGNKTFNLKSSYFTKVKITDRVIINKYIGVIEDNKIIVSDVIFK
jgi:hypothetical protein